MDDFHRMCKRVCKQACPSPGDQLLPAPCAISTVASPMKRPITAPTMSMGTNKPLLIAEPAGATGGVSAVASEGSLRQSQ